MKKLITLLHIACLFFAATTVIHAQQAGGPQYAGIEMEVSPSIAVYGETVTITATVTGDNPWVPNDFPTGEVKFWTLDPITSSQIDFGTVTLRQVVPVTPLTQQTSVATLTISSLNVGIYRIVGEYNGDNNFNGCMSSVDFDNLKIIPANTTVEITELELTNNQQTLKVWAQVSVTAPGNGFPTNGVAFYLDGSDTPFGIGLMGMFNSAGVSITLPFTEGKHTVTAKYLGDTNFNASAMSPAESFTVSATPEFSDPSTIYKYYGDPKFALPSVTGGLGDGPYQYRSDNPNVASVDAATGQVTVVSVGETNMYVKRLASGSFNDSPESLPVKVVVLPKPVTAAGINATKEYDGTNVFTNAQIDITGAVVIGIVGLDVVTLSKIGVTGTFGPNVGTGTLTLSGNFSLTGADARNYTLSPQPTVTARITARLTPIIVTARSGSSNYGDSPANPGISATGLAGGDTESVLTGLSNSFGITATTPVGVYTLTVTGTLTNPNYTISARQTGEWTVNKRPITITAIDKTINPGETPVLDYKITSGELVNGDVLTGAIHCAPPYTAGEHAITQGTLSAGANYAITFVPGTLTVRSDDASVSRLEVDGVSSERSGNNFNILAQCGASSVNINVTADRFATVKINNIQQNPLRVNLSNYGNNTFSIQVTAQTGNSETYTLTIYRSVPTDVAFFDRFKDVLTVPVYMEGIGAVSSVEWYHNGSLMQRSPSKGYVEMKEAGAYYALLNGQFRTCEVIKTRSASSSMMSVYPNPVVANQEITVYFENPVDSEEAQLQILSIDGRLLKTLPVDSNQQKIKVTAPAYSGLVVLKMVSSTVNQEIKLIIK